MNRQTHKLQQGSPEWHAFRAKHFGASELPAATGVSKYTTRGDLVKEKATGISKEIDARTQALFDKGHAAEEAGRILAELIIGETLSPKVMSIELDGLPLSASLDGISDDGLVVFEHKLWSEKLAEAVKNNDLDPHYCMQLDQQLLVSGAKKVLFMTSDGTEENMAWMWYDAAQADYEEICNTWKQFAADVAAYVPVEVIEKPKAEAIKALPSVFVQATGMVTASNLEEFAAAATTFIAAIKTELTTDQDFADAEATVKFCKDAEANLEATKAGVLAQMTTVDEVTRTLDHIASQLRDKRLMLDKLVKSEKEARKLAIISKAREDFNAHFVALESEITPIRLIAQHPDFGGAMKGLKKLSAMQDAVDTALRDGKFEAEQKAKDVRAKLQWFKERTMFGNPAIFHDLQLLMNKPMDDFQLAVSTRLQEEAKRETEQRAKMEAAAKEKAEAAALAELIASQERIRAEERAKAEMEQKAEREAMQREHDKALAGEPAVIQATITNNPPSEAVTQDGARPAAVSQMEPAAPATVTTIGKPSRPSDNELIEFVARNFNVSFGKASDWIIETAERIKVAA